MEKGGRGASILQQRLHERGCNTAVPGNAVPTGKRVSGGGGSEMGFEREGGHFEPNSRLQKQQRWTG